MIKKVTIIGGTSGFGEWIAKYLINNFAKKVEITITGRAYKKGIQVSKKLGCNFSDDNILAVKDADVTIFSVPISFMKETIKQVAPFLKENSIAIDVCSIKKIPSKALRKYSPPSVIVIPSHPMFGPYIDSIAGQIFVLTPDEEVKQNQSYKDIYKYLNSKGAVVIESNPVYHDKMMAVVQGLTHYNMFVYGETIKRLGINIEDSMNFVSPIYKLMISSVSRYMNQDAKLYGDIQMYNDENLEVHKTFIDVTKDFSRLIKDKNEDEFIKLIDGTKEYFGDNALKGQNYTDKVIYMLSNQIEKIKDNIGNRVVLQSIFGPEKIKGKLLKFEKNLIYLDSGKSYDLDKYYIK